MSSKRNGDSLRGNQASANKKPICFIIMPISDPDGYKPGHFQHVFDDLLAPACDKAGYQALRADQVRETNLIHLDVLQRIIDSPMVLCDLSSRNPNVLFELGLRQAFDKPVALVQEVGTPQIFDITPLRFANYRSELIYHEVLEDQDGVAALISATKQATTDPNSVNSIVKLLGLTHPASRTNITETDRDSAMLQLIMTELTNLRSEIWSTTSASVSSSVSPTHGKRQVLPQLLMDISEELELLEFKVDNLVHETIPPMDLTAEITNLDERLRLAIVQMKGLIPKAEQAIAGVMRSRLHRLLVIHKDYLSEAKEGQGR